MYDDPSNGLYISEEEAIPSSSQIRFLLKDPNCDYKVIIEGSAPENIHAGDFNVRFYSSNNPKGNQQQIQEANEDEEEEEDPENATIVKMEVVEPLEYVDQYKPYKYGVIFRERLFCHDVIQGVISLKLFERAKIEESEEEGGKGKGKK